MRPLGALLIVVGLAFSAGAWLAPTEVRVLGTSASCGMPIVRLYQDESASSAMEVALLKQCVSQSSDRFVLGLVVGGILGTAGLMIMVYSGRGKRPNPASLASYQGSGPPPGW
jgi:hypothetical protein